MEYIIFNLLLYEAAIMAVIVIIAVFIFLRITKSAEKAADREHELRKLQIQEGLHKTSPTVFLQLDKPPEPPIPFPGKHILHSMPYNQRHARPSAR